MTRPSRRPGSPNGLWLFVLLVVVFFASEVTFFVVAGSLPDDHMEIPATR